MSGSLTTTITATFVIPNDYYVGSDGIHTTMPPGGNDNLQFPLVTTAELMANPSLVSSRAEDVTSLLAVLAISNQAYGVQLAALAVSADD